MALYRVFGQITLNGGGTMSEINVQLIKNGPGMFFGPVASDTPDGSGNYDLIYEATPDGGTLTPTVGLGVEHYTGEGTPRDFDFGGEFEDDFTVTYTNENPTKGSIGNLSFDEDQGSIDTFFSISDDESDVMTVVKVSGPPWVTVSTPSQSQGKLTTNTNTPEPGGYSAAVKVVDDQGGESATENFTVTINDVNAAPVLSNPGTKNYVNKSGNQTVQLSATDADDDPLTYSKTQGPSWGTVNPTTGLVTFATNSATKGAHQFGWRASDGTDSDTEVHTVNITNNTPTLAAVGNQRFLKNTGVQTLQLVGADLDNDPLTYSKTVGPSWGTVNSSTGLVSFNTTGLSDGVTNFTFRVSDGTATADRSFTVEIYTAAPSPTFAMVT